MTTKAPETGAGRPPKNPHTKRYWETRLHKFLLPRFQKIPDLVRDNRINVRKIATESDVAPFSIYRWFHGNLTINGARKLCAATVTKEYPEGTVTVEELIDYIT